jgi:hypothetical protein
VSRSRFTAHSAPGFLLHKKNRFIPAKKKHDALALSRANFSPSLIGICHESRTRRSIMTVKLCDNPQCAVYGHLVFTPATRCVFCRWDLYPVRQRSETAPLRDSPPLPVRDKSAHNSLHPGREGLRQTAL